MREYRIKTGPKIVALALLAFCIVFGLKKLVESGIIPGVGFAKSIVPEKANLPSAHEAQVANVKPVALPSSTPANVPGKPVCASIWEWNAQFGLMYANGGAEPTKGSLMAQRGVNLRLRRQDDTMQMVSELVKCAKEIEGGAPSCDCSSGANFVIIMGDGAGQFAQMYNSAAKTAKLSPNSGLKVIGAVGASFGEDAFWAPAEVKADPQAAKGIVVLGVLRDGDWNIALNWAGANGIKNNPDEKTYDPEAINWINAPDYNKAAEMYVAGTCEDRRVVKDGKPTGETKKVCANGVVTWTPGDVVLAKNKGGLVRVVSSKEYASQMPSVVIGPKPFFAANREVITSMLAAIFEGSDQVKAFDQAKKFAAQVSAKVYDDRTLDWYKYFNGTKERDATGVMVDLGGSRVYGLADNLMLFGITQGANDNFRSTYTTFAKIATQQYPDLFKEMPIPDVKEVEDRSFITGVQAIIDAGETAPVEAVAYAKQADGPVVSKRAYNITFESGKATLTPDGEHALLNLKDNLAINNLFIKVSGHTDALGSDTVNIPLSQARARAVKEYLQTKAPRNFPDSRFDVSGYGATRPVATNATAGGRAQNRRVEIVLSGS